MLWEVDLGQKSLVPVTLITGFLLSFCDGCHRCCVIPHDPERFEVLSCLHADGSAPFSWELEIETG